MLPNYASIFDENPWALDPRPMLFCDPETNELILNKALVESIKQSSVSHELWITDECLAVWFNRFTQGMSATWIDDTGDHYGKKVGWYWVERLHQPENDRRAVKLTIEDYRDFIWVLHLHDDEQWYDKRLNIRKGVWPD